MHWRREPERRNGNTETLLFRFGVCVFTRWLLSLGQFGVGFYSSFMCANHVKVYSRSATKGAVGYLWESDGYVFDVDTYSVFWLYLCVEGVDVCVCVCVKCHYSYVSLLAISISAYVC